jgi:hypothetical protein
VDETGNWTVADLFRDRHILWPDAEFEKSEAWERSFARVLAALKTLSPRDQRIVVCRYRMAEHAIPLGIVDPASITWTNVTTYWDKAGEFHKVVTPNGRPEATGDALGGREVGADGPIGSRHEYSFKWPLPSSVAGIARKLGLSRQAVYNVLARYDALMEKK